MGTRHWRRRKICIHLESCSRDQCIALFMSPPTPMWLISCHVLPYIHWLCLSAVWCSAGSVLLNSRAFQQRTAACYNKLWVVKPKQWAESCRTGANYYEWTHSYTSCHNPSVRINVGRVRFYKTTDALTCFFGTIKNCCPVTMLFLCAG